ncbi:MAG: divalent-cation tolerance protein CutA [Terracidiphilus sp.]
MPETGSYACIVLTTAANREEAARLARALVEEGLAACTTLVPGVESVYRWQGRIESASETLLLVKTGSDHLRALEARLQALHSYQTPEFLAFRADLVSQSYLDWLEASLRPI